MLRLILNLSIRLIIYTWIVCLQSHLATAQTKSVRSPSEKDFSIIHFCDPGELKSRKEDASFTESPNCIKEAFFHRLSKEPLHAFVHFDNLGFSDQVDWSSSIKMCFTGSTLSACNILKRLSANSQKSYDKGGHEMTWMLTCSRVENANILVKMQSRHDWVSKEKIGSFTLTVCEDETMEPPSEQKNDPF